MCNRVTPEYYWIKFAGKELIARKLGEFYVAVNDDGESFGTLEKDLDEKPIYCPSTCPNPNFNYYVNPKETTSV